MRLYISLLQLGLCYAGHKHSGLAGLSKLREIIVRDVVIFLLDTVLQLMDHRE